jgi:hypothetical protein
MTQPLVSLTVNLTPMDIYRVSARLLARRLLFLGIFAALILLLGLLLFVPGIPKEPENQIRGGLPYGMYLLAAYLILVFVFPFFSAKSSFRRSPGMQGPINYTFSNEGIDVQTKVSTAHCLWPVFNRVLETKSYLLLFQNKIIGNIIPKRDILDEPALSQLRQLIRENVKGKNKLRG